MKFYIKNFRNLIVRLVTGDKYYVCDECRTIHKRDGTEINFAEPGGIGELMVSRWWYASICRIGYNAVIDKAHSILRESIFGKR